MDEDANTLDAVSENSKESIEEKPFDFEKLYSYMNNSILGNSSVNEDVDSVKPDSVDNHTCDVNLENYLLAYEQLYNFFIMLGTAFQFVALDVKSKIKILKSYQDAEKEKENENGKVGSVNHFATVNSMVDYEEKNQLLTNPKYISGCRTLLRLHRGLDFVRKFLAEVYRLDNDTKLCNTAKEVYNQTLAKYHSWVIRNTAKLAMQFLPSRIELLQRISCHSEEKLNRMLQIYPNAINAMDSVYDIVENIYTINNLHNLP